MLTMEELARQERALRYGTVRHRASTDPMTYDAVAAELLEHPALRTRARNWQRRREGAIADFVTGFEHRVLPTVTVADVELALERSTHALGQLEKTRDTDHFISRANPPWAMAYLFHDCMEHHTGRVPTWNDFFAYVTTEAAAKWWLPVKATARARRIGVNQTNRAMRWRLATAWQSAIRTTYALAALRHRHGIEVRYHLFAHVELKIDGWHEGRAVRLVMPSEWEDRKTSAHTIFAGTGIEIFDMGVSRQGRGSVWLPTDETLGRAAGFLTARPTAAAEQQSLFG